MYGYLPYFFVIISNKIFFANVIYWHNTYIYNNLIKEMQENASCITNTLDGTNHKTPKLDFTIDHMDLIIEPFFESKTIKCEQQLIITAKENIHNLDLDSA